MSENFDKFAILESFLDEVTSYLPEMEANLDTLQQQPDDMNIIEETYRRAHTISGSAAMMDFGNLAHVAQGIEDILGHAIDAQASLDVPTIGLLRRSFSRLSRLVEHIRSNTDGTSLVAEDDADRGAWRGLGATSGSGALPVNGGMGNSGGLSPSGGTSRPEATADGPEAPGMAVPDWLAPFAASDGAITPPPTPSGQFPRVTQTTQPNPQMSGFPEDSSDTPTGPMPAIQPRPPTPSTPFAMDQSGMPPASMASDPWASSISGYPTGQVPGMPPSQPTSAPQFAVETAHSYEDILSAFRARAQDDESIGDEQDLAPTAPRMPAAPLTGSSAGGWQWPESSGVDFSMLGTNQLPQVGGYSNSPTYPTTGQAGPQSGTQVEASFDDLRQGEEAVRRQIAALRDVASTVYGAAKSMEDERTELRGFLDGSRDALDRLEEWAGRQMGLDLRRSPDSVRRYLPLSVIWVTTMRLKKLIALLNNMGRGITATEEQIEETLNDLHVALTSFGQIFQSMSAVGGAPENGFSATVAQFSWSPPEAKPPSAGAVGSSASIPEIPSLNAGTRAALERDVREQLRRELEDEVRAEIAAEVRRDEEDHLRQELQIQVRRQLLTELTPDQYSDAGGRGMQSILSAIPMATGRSSTPVQITSEQSPEAIEVFREEAQEHLQTITSGIAELESSPHDSGSLQNIRRAMHTLKGAAGMMGFVSIQQTAHVSEDLLDRLVQQSLNLTTEALSLLLDTSEALDYMVTKVLNQPAEQHRLLQSLASRYTQLTGSQLASELRSSPSNGGRATDAVLIGSEDDTDDHVEPKTPESTDLSVRLQLSKLDDLVNLFGELLINRSVLEERVDRLNRLVSDGNSVSERLRDVSSHIETGFEAAALPSGPGSIAGNMAMMSGMPGGQDRSGWPAVTGGRSSQGFHELELDRYTEFHQLTRGLSEGVADIVTLTHEMESVLRECQASFARESRLSSDFQERLLKARLVPLQSLVPRLYRAARASALREGKEIEFYADGADTEVDRKVFEEVVGPLLHLVRNAVNHGIERPEVRQAAGKPSAGKILVSASYEGNQVVISVRDDGAGIDTQRIRDTAVARGWIDSYSQLSEKEAINLIFQPGITTAESLTEEAGRGVGLDVVRDTVNRLRGTMEVESVVGQGTVFTMKFPISLQITRAVLVKVKNQTLAVPMAVVDQIGRLDYYQTVAAPLPSIEVRGERFPLAHLASYLRLQPGPVQDRSSVLLANAGNRRVALLVDAVLVQQEIVVKPLGPHLRDVRGVAGAAVLGNGQVVVILELHELLAQQPADPVILPVPGAGGRSTAGTGAAEQDFFATSREINSHNLSASYPQTQGSSSQVVSSTLPTEIMATPPGSGSAPFVISSHLPTPSAPHRVALGSSAQSAYVLVVDDSPSVRRVVSNMLRANGWDVQTARDGVEALEVIARQIPAAVLLDIEMPRMDGYELMATVRSQEQYRNLPLIVLTSRAATKHHQRAFQLGADAYLVKPYQDEELLSTLARLVKEQ
jgi:chemotaxis protein histidine kinase CheA/ActR/RegA family two-component response regulator